MQDWSWVARDWMRMFCTWFMTMIRRFSRVCSFPDRLDRCWGIHTSGDFKTRVRTCMVPDAKPFSIVKLPLDPLLSILPVLLLENIFPYDLEHFNRFHNGPLDRNLCRFYSCQDTFMFYHSFYIFVPCTSFQSCYF